MLRCSVFYFSNAFFVFIWCTDFSCAGRNVCTIACAAQLECSRNPFASFEEPEELTKIFTQFLHPDHKEVRPL